MLTLKNIVSQKYQIRSKTYKMFDQQIETNEDDEDDSDSQGLPTVPLGNTDASGDSEDDAE